MCLNLSEHRKNIWFLQITLSISIKKFVACLLEEERSFEEILSILEKNFNTLCNIKQKYEDFLKTEITNHILIREEIEFIRQKKLSLEAPLALEYRGNPEVLSRSLIGIVGSRHPTYYGKIQAQKFARILSQAGYGVISGGAIGIDAIANSYALEGIGGSISVIGNGIKNPYPTSNRNLFKKLSNEKNGLLLSEFTSDARVQKWHFPKRNETIAELCDFLLVIEAKPTSGSLMTARFAKECGKALGAIPGNIDNPNTIGSHLLIQNGAHCIHDPNEVIKFMNEIHKSR